jgi:hypothetical protein
MESQAHYPCTIENIKKQNHIAKYASPLFFLVSHIYYDIFPAIVKTSPVIQKAKRAQ